ncbi:FAD dependent oxidoreductase [Fusarium redolens]|uniref:FAD dependent oxidoreductase n=1 Tax=Fusarium redolens TaxID=48865 RepID=A0A9P9KSN1_FUSRE|nr:FAD dependent oxidoreductase [Fusarium redolens]KAH7267791.1 FAD dependent oxidoreductase [Fusarium redolens]
MYVVLGAGVVGLTTALELKRQYPSSNVVVLARDLPGDSAPTYASAWAGGNWISSATDNGPQEEWDRVTYLKFQELAKAHPECGIEPMDLRSVYEDNIENVNLLSRVTNKIWYNDLVGGIKYLPKEELPQGTKFGFEVSTFVINVQKYLPWLQFEATKLGIEIRRAIIDDLSDIPGRFPTTSAIFNCTGLGSLALKGVEDHHVYPAKGQVYIVEAPPSGISKMYFRSSQRLGSHSTHVFPRGKDGGVVLGGCRLNGDSNEQFDPVIGQGIKERCCALVPELGRAENLRIIKQGVGFRPSRKGGARIELERKYGVKVIHNYGAGGSGYQASWGMAKAAVDLLRPSGRL